MIIVFPFLLVNKCFYSKNGNYGYECNRFNMNYTCFRFTYFLLQTDCGFKTSALNASKYLIHQCSLCPGDKSFFCEWCRIDLCLLCKDLVQDLKTKDHNVMTYREKINCTLIQEICAIHAYVYGIYCESYELPICSYCTDHRKH